ncbi:hypothetical protein DL95DRAFT_278627, partial [Leptodontidium sp. 2 PMI_412]
GIATPQPVQPGIVTNCNRFYKVKGGDTCTTIASQAGISVAQLAAWNIQIGGTACTSIWADYYVCTGIIGSSPDGMVSNCNRWYRVKAGDTCATVASQVGVTVAQLTTWNKGIGGTACTGMWAEYYLCT